MLEKRVKHERVILKQKALTAKENESAPDEVELSKKMAEQEEAGEELVQEAFSTVIAPKRRINSKPFDPDQPKKKRVKNVVVKDEENYIPYVAKDHHGESG